MDAISNITFIADQCGNDPVLKTIWDDMRDELKLIGCENTSWKYNDLYSYASLVIDDQIVSTVFYAPIIKDQIAYIAGAYTDPKWRTNGIYSQLWNLFVDLCGKDENLTYIQSGYHKNNIKSKLMQESQKRPIFGETETYIRTRIDLRDGNIIFQDITADRMVQVGKMVNIRLANPTKWRTSFEYFLEKSKIVVDRILNR